MIRRHTDFQSVALPTELPGRRLQIRREPLLQASSAQDAIYYGRSCQRDMRISWARNANKAGIRPAAIVRLHYERRPLPLCARHGQVRFVPFVRLKSFMRCGSGLK